VTKGNKLQVGSKWRFKSASKKLLVKIFDIEIWTIAGKKNVVVVYGLISAKAGHICQNVSGFKENHEREKS